MDLADTYAVFDVENSPKKRNSSEQKLPRGFKKKKSIKPSISNNSKHHTMPRTRLLKLIGMQGIKEQEENIFLDLLNKQAETLRAGWKYI